MKYTKQEQKIALEKALIKFRERLGGQTFAQHLIKSKLFSLGVTQTIRKGEADRVLIGENVIYEIDAHKILISLIDLTNMAVSKSKINFDFIAKLKILCNSNI